MADMEQILAEHPFLIGFEPTLVRVIAGCAKNCRFKAEEYLCREGDAADTFYLIRHGMVSLEVAVPGRTPVIIETLGEGEIVGSSWFVPPYRWQFDARAMDYTRAISVNAKCLRDKCEADHHLGYEMTKRFLPTLAKRLHATRLQILDVYGNS